MNIFPKHTPSAYILAGLFMLTAAAPVTGKVTLYEHYDYGGKSWTLGVGSYGFDQVSRSPVGNDAVSSFRIANGYKLVACKHGSFTDCRTFTSSQARAPLNDEYSSFKVQIKGPAESYLPIFRFDGDAGSWCFPDDKRKKSERDNKCKSFSRTAPVFVSEKECGSYKVYQYNLWYGQQKGCAVSFINFAGERHGNDNEYVQVWVRNGKAEWVRYNQHNGYYFRKVGNGAEMRGNRPVAYIGKISHGAYHRKCTGNPFSGGTSRCLGTVVSDCFYWEDYRNPNGKYDLDQGTLLFDPDPRPIDCNPGACKEGHSYGRGIADSSCYGVSN